MGQIIKNVIIPVLAALGFYTFSCNVYDMPLNGSHPFTDPVIGGIFAIVSMGAGFITWLGVNAYPKVSRATWE